VFTAKIHNGSPGDKGKYTIISCNAFFTGYKEQDRPFILSNEDQATPERAA
jgi:hypothetical protein